jgi:hypothetical protein
MSGIFSREGIGQLDIAGVRVEIDKVVRTKQLKQVFHSTFGHSACRNDLCSRRRLSISSKELQDCSPNEILIGFKPERPSVEQTRARRESPV